MRISLRREGVVLPKLDPPVGRGREMCGFMIVGGGANSESERVVEIVVESSRVESSGTPGVCMEAHSVRGIRFERAIAWR
jgi:hypothetical protein